MLNVKSSKQNLKCEMNFQVTSTASTRTCSACSSTAASLLSRTTSSWATTSTGASKVSNQSVSCSPTRSSIQKISSFLEAIMSVPVLTGFTDSTMNVRKQLISVSFLKIYCSVYINNITKNY